MKSTEVSRARVVAIAISLAIATLAYAVAERSTARQAAAVSPSQARGAVEAELARTGIAGQLEDVLGKAFGGVWFEPSALQLHVGITSPASRREAEAVAARVGFAEHLTETPVRSSWAELEAAQARWSNRLADLFAKGKVATALAPDYNSVQVKLSTDVSLSRRAVLEREAAADSVKVSIEIDPALRSPIVLTAQCKEFVSLAAKCDPTIVSGVTLNGEVKEQCTLGPLIIRHDRSTEAKATETYALTAGHCIKYNGGNGKKWSAINKGAEVKELGKSLEYLLPTVVGVPELDVGVVKIESNYWVKAEDPPVTAARAEWSAVTETEPTIVLKEEDPIKNTKSCFSGQRSSVQCGTVKNAKMQRPVIYTPNITTTVKDVAEVELESGKSGKGDSGAPWFNQESPAVLQGTTVGIVPAKAGEEESKIVFFQLLSSSLENLGTEFDLLTFKNEIRHP